MGSSMPSPGGMSMCIAIPLGLGGWPAFGWERRPCEETGRSVCCREVAARQEGLRALPRSPRPHGPTAPQPLLHRGQVLEGPALGRDAVRTGAPKQSSFTIAEWKPHPPPPGREPCFGHVSS